MVNGNPPNEITGVIDVPIQAAEERTIRRIRLCLQAGPKNWLRNLAFRRCNADREFFSSLYRHFRHTKKPPPYWRGL